MSARNDWDGLYIHEAKWALNWQSVVILTLYESKFRAPLHAVVLLMSNSSKPLTTLLTNTSEIIGYESHFFEWQS